MDNLELGRDIFEVMEASLKPKLSPQLTRFTKAFDGDVVYALRVAGFHGTDLYLQSKGKELLARPDICQAIRNQIVKSDKKEGALLTKIDRMEFLAAVVRNADPYERMIKDDYGQEMAPPPPSVAERLKALDMYNKMEGDYHTNVNVNHNVNIGDLILSSYTEVSRSLEDIEADYINIDNRPDTIPDLDTLGL